MTIWELLWFLFGGASLVFAGVIATAVIIIILIIVGVVVGLAKGNRTHHITSSSKDRGEPRE